MQDPKKACQEAMQSQEFLSAMQNDFGLSASDIMQMMQKCNKPNPMDSIKCIETYGNSTFQKLINDTLVQCAQIKTQGGDMQQCMDTLMENLYKIDPKLNLLVAACANPSMDLLPASPQMMGKKPWYEEWWVWLIVAIVILLAVAIGAKVWYGKRPMFFGRKRL